MKRNEGDDFPVFYAIDENGTVRNVPDLSNWKTTLMQGNYRLVDDISKTVQIATIFTGVDKSLGRNKLPVIFETIIFGGKRDGEIYNYTSWADAQEGHAKLLNELRSI